VKGPLAGFVGHELDASHQPHAARLAHEWMTRKRLEPRLEVRDEPGRLPDNVVAFIDLERLERDGGGKGMAAIGEAIGEGADLAALVQHRLVDGLWHGDGAA
jgi:hypothetical protein